MSQKGKRGRELWSERYQKLVRSSLIHRRHANLSAVIVTLSERSELRSTSLRVPCEASARIEEQSCVCPSSTCSSIATASFHVEQSTQAISSTRRLLDHNLLAPIDPAVLPRSRGSNTDRWSNVRSHQLITLRTCTQCVHRVASGKEWAGAELVHGVEARRGGGRSVAQTRRGVGWVAQAHGGLVTAVARAVGFDVVLTFRCVHGSLELGQVFVRL
jgi:hypothetical protein